MIPLRIALAACISMSLVVAASAGDAVITHRQIEADWLRQDVVRNLPPNTDPANGPVGLTPAGTKLAVPSSDAKQNQRAQYQRVRFQWSHTSRQRAFVEFIVDGQ